MARAWPSDSSAGTPRRSTPSHALESIACRSSRRCSRTRTPSPATARRPRALLDELMAGHADRYISPYDIAVVHAGLGDTDARSTSSRPRSTSARRGWCSSTSTRASTLARRDAVRRDRRETAVIGSVRYAALPHRDSQPEVVSSTLARSRRPQGRPSQKASCPATTRPVPSASFAWRQARRPLLCYPDPEHATQELLSTRLQRNRSSASSAKTPPRGRGRRRCVRAQRNPHRRDHA